MTDIIKIEQKDGKDTVSAKELYEFLGFDKSQWSRWALKNIDQDDFFIHGVDYVGFDTVSNGNPTKDYALTLDMAKEISMLARNAKGKQARLYFIEVEKVAREAFSGPRLLAKAVLEAQAMLERKDQLILEMKPKAEYFDAVAGSKGAVKMAECAKELDFPEMGRNKLFQFLRDNGVLQQNNQPYQAMIDRGYFRLVQASYTTPDGETHLTSTTLVHPKGMDHIRKLLIQNGFEPKKESSVDQRGLK